MNLTELQQKVDRLIQNIAEQNRRAYQIFYDPNPQDVILPQLDENGNLVNVTIPNRAKIKAEIDNFINDAKQKIETGFDVVCFIDPQNGSDDNDGSITAPFRSFKKIDAPYGAKILIHLFGDIEIDSDIYLNGRDIEVIAPTEVNITFLSKSYAGYESFYWLQARKVRFNGNVNLIADSNPATDNDSDTYAYLIDCDEFEFTSGKIDLGSKRNVRLLRSYWTTSGLLKTVFKNTILHFDLDLNQKIIRLDTYRPINLIFSASSLTLPQDYTVADMLSGIIKDTNGIPRNILSNIIF